MLGTTISLSVLGKFHFHFGGGVSFELVLYVRLLIMS